MKSIEVRCCCDAGKIMGWMLTDKRLGPGLYQFRVMGVDGKPKNVELELTTLSQRNIAGARIDAEAMRSNDYPMEELKQIPNFVENPRANEADDTKPLRDIISLITEITDAG